MFALQMDAAGSDSCLIATVPCFRSTLLTSGHPSTISVLSLLSSSFQPCLPPAPDY